MNAALDTAWQSEFGIAQQSDAMFFASKADLDSRDLRVPYAHVLRRAFDLLNLDGIWCDQHAPLIYFKVVARMQPDEMFSLQNQFWNHGGAAILVVISPTQVHVYSGLARPIHNQDATAENRALVVILTRSSNALREFLPSVESGEFFRRHARSFDTQQRVDQVLLDNLQLTRTKLALITEGDATTEELDAFLCRLVFTCYLFDRKVIGESYLQEVGLPNLPHLRDILDLQSGHSRKNYLYRLFAKLAQDFNGDLFSDDLEMEARNLSEDHFEVVKTFFHATDMLTGQQPFWPYDFGIIPIETISAIYERFLKPSDKKAGAFYTPRFLAELVLDIAFKDTPSLLGRRFLDPSCGSGIFLVGIFNRLADEWSRTHPDARNDVRARELMSLLQNSIYGIDINFTACRITAFSLYLAYLDQLTPRDIQELQSKGNALPRLVAQQDQDNVSNSNTKIWCGDFFHEGASYPFDIDFIIGNPPWGSIIEAGSLVESWCIKYNVIISDKQIAYAFMIKAAYHAIDNGRICLVLPHGILFKRSRTAIALQKYFISTYTLDLVLNLTDYQRFLFNKSEFPAMVFSYRKALPNKDHAIDYWVPRTDWKVKNAELITVSELDRSIISLKSILRDIDGVDGPQIWKKMTWASPRDRRLLSRLTDMPRLRDYVRQTREKAPDKPWLIAEGFQSLSTGDNPEDASELKLPSKLYIDGRSASLHLFLLPEDCVEQKSSIVTVRAGSNKNVEVFMNPLVISTKGFTKIAFADFPVSFKGIARGINGPPEDRDLLMFLAAYMRSSLARYFLFHTSSNWGVSRQMVGVDELLGLPFIWPNSTLTNEIVSNVAHLIKRAMKNAHEPLVNRNRLVADVQNQIEPLIFAYFDIISVEKILIADTINIIIPSFRPSVRGKSTPSIRTSTTQQIRNYTDLLCTTLNDWAKQTISQVVSSSIISTRMGIGVIKLDRNGNITPTPISAELDVMEALILLQTSASMLSNTVEILRGIKIFVGNSLYIVKPLSHRYWTETTALNDADEIAGSILMRQPRKTM